MSPAYTWVKATLETDSEIEGKARAELRRAPNELSVIHRQELSLLHR